jgi:hypothetical protein
MEGKPTKRPPVLAGLKKINLKTTETDYPQNTLDVLARNGLSIYNSFKVGSFHPRKGQFSRPCQKPCS